MCGRRRLVPGAGLALPRNIPPRRTPSKVKDARYGMVRPCPWQRRPRQQPSCYAAASGDGRTSVRHDESPHGATHFLTKTLPKVAAEMALSVLAYNLTRVMNIVGIKPLIAAIADLGLRHTRPLASGTDALLRPFLHGRLATMPSEAIQPLAPAWPSTVACCATSKRCPSFRHFMTQWTIRNRLAHGAAAQ